MASSADETADSEYQAWCHDRTEARRYRPPRGREREQLKPCGFCFPEGIECDESDIIVPWTQQSDRRLHRVKESDGTDWTPPESQDCNLTRTMAREDVTTWDDLADALEEGGS